MQYDSDILTIEEVFEYESDEVRSVLNAVEYSIRVGDNFFIITPYNDETYVVEAIEEQYDSWTIIYNGGRRVAIKDIFPLFSVGSLISMLSLDNEFNLRTAGAKWIVSFDHYHEYASEENELLVTFLWYVLKDVCVRGLISRS
ncbi:hypothetical protein HF638_21145 [Paenibacillus sp. SZ31]|uniref:hypothetical protein n=1 Tax=unclassified Paenibacillus TaxID=185978 RepID=UPI00146CFE14|nr:hypothetical protein [Paenibacillus sp. SZ31]NMI06494.1 hypothetical protein [Paenibacillus sp. SZ31]